MHPLKVLVVDDEPLVCRTVLHALRDRAEVTCADSAATALHESEHAIRRGEYDLVFLDVWMPGLPDGIDFYRQLQDLGPRMPAVVFMTGDPRAAGAVRDRLTAFCIDKPFDRETLLRTMEHALAPRPVSRPSAAYRRP